MSTKPTSTPEASSTSDSDGGNETPPLRVNRTKVGIRARPAPDGDMALTHPQLYFNREISTLQFHIRVLEQALDDAHPILNRVMFLLIFSSNLDEFFEIRVAGLKQALLIDEHAHSRDGQTYQQTLNEISDIAHEHVARQYQILNDVLIPALEQENVRFLRRSRWTKAQKDWVSDYFYREIQPVISPIGLDPSHPFPRLVNKSLNFIVELEGSDAFGRSGGLAIIPAPRSLPRLIRFPEAISGNGSVDYAFLSSMIHAHADALFPGMTIKGCYQFRLTRNADLSVNPEEVSDLASALKGELLARRYGDGVRLEIANNCPAHLADFLLNQFGLMDQDLYLVDGPVNLSRMMAVINDTHRSDLLYGPFVPGLPKPLKHRRGSYFDAVAQDDILLHHPYQSFAPVEHWLKEAASDPNVLAIKQTLYRTGPHSEIVSALADAARNGKEVTVVIELRARFDEADNIELASRLQEAGANVIYGMMDFKIHAKLMHMVRREQGELRHYAHLGTGNYHATTAKLYTDYSLLTADHKLCRDVHLIFQQIAGMGQPRQTHYLLHAPFTLHSTLIELIDREIEHVKRGCKGYILFKCNSLTEPRLIQALYRASQAGIECDLIIRSTCCLRPGVEGVSDNIRVRSIVGRFLEHTRVYYFRNANRPQLWCGSADAMERNMFHRVESCFPVLNQKLARQIKKDMDTYLLDNCQSWQLCADGHYERSTPSGDEEAISAQETLLYAYALKR
ncbi:polyphosphate kinase 1 [Larsenimonas suaedae]|uniref:Polyphosphate kinase n=1 Tax=Larsenimonas suaedae TaxID=1851019 RepID=A0ABU1GTL2_9GAMM|nr:polyphosphate kinase 1 [Larsenimonas suaedae]MCM2972298.1 polyphosphate kinase 1 [Larsenimonas suaedae]MDR5894906.1 polyphosphate kinase 1 [Larsenimonas suaedae]